jgi:hypothetical protein
VSPVVVAGAITVAVAVAVAGTVRGLSSFRMCINRGSIVWAIVGKRARYRHWRGCEDRKIRVETGRGDLTGWSPVQSGGREVMRRPGELLEIKVVVVRLMCECDESQR